MYKYKAKVYRVVDGDTVYVTVQLGFFVSTKLKLRLAGINTPEIRGEEREKGLEATEYLKGLLGDGEIMIASHKTGKYGRWIARLYAPTREGEDTEEFVLHHDEKEDGTYTSYIDINETLVKAGHAKRVEY